MWLLHLHRCLQRLGALVLLTLLALGPFLHAHWGQTVRAGFHMDGVSLHHHDSGPGAGVISADDEHESPAVGVASSLPRGVEKTLSAHDVGLWTCSLLLAVLACLSALPIRSRPTRRHPRRLTRGHWPPLALAPPRF